MPAEREERETLIEGIVKGMRESGRDPEPGLPILRGMDLTYLRRLYEYWAFQSGPRCVY